MKTGLRFRLREAMRPVQGLPPGAGDLWRHRQPLGAGGLA